MPPHFGVRAQQIPRAGQQIGEIERALLALQLLIPSGRRLELFLQERREIAVGVGPELKRSRIERVARRKDVTRTSVPYLAPYPFRVLASP